MAGSIATVVIIGCAGCTAGRAAGPASAARSSASAAPSSASAVPLPDRALASPGCSTSIAPSPQLSGVRTATTDVPGNPFGVAVTKDGRWAFVALQQSIEVLRIGAALAPARVRVVALPQGSMALGLTLTPDGRYLLAASNAGAVVLDIARAEQGAAAGVVLGTLRAPGEAGAIEVAVSPDGTFAFVSEEDTDATAVFNLRLALTRGFGAADYVGKIPLGVAPVGLAVSPDGRWLYATSEVADNSIRTGTLTVIDLRRAEIDTASSITAVADAGCEPVRVIASADGSQVWVTARASDDVLCFAAARLPATPSRALVAIVPVGEAPVGLIMVRGGSRIVVADSNRFGASGARSDLGVVDVAAALAGKPALLGHIPAGKFPREMALERDGSVLLAGNYMSRQLEAVSVPTLP